MAFYWPRIVNFHADADDIKGQSAKSRSASSSNHRIYLPAQIKYRKTTLNYETIIIIQT